MFTPVALAIPVGYRYVGSRVVSEGRHVYWYWNADFFQADAAGISFIAQMHARNIELNEERGFVAIIRCDTRSYRRAESSRKIFVVRQASDHLLVELFHSTARHVENHLNSNSSLNRTFDISQNPDIIPNNVEINYFFRLFIILIKF
jgi:hypothetical protein